MYAIKFRSFSLNRMAVPNNLLSATVIQGLQNLCTALTPDLTNKLIANSLKLTLYPDATITPVPELYASRQADKAKQSEYAVVTLYALATKHCWDSLTMRQELETIDINANAIDELTRIYDDNRKELLLRQLQLGHNFPHITDIQWRIVCDVKSSTVDSSSGEVNFLINLGRYHQGSGERETIVEFLSNSEELHALINRLKEIKRHCNKMSTEM